MSSISGLSSNHLQPVQQTSSGGNAPAKTARNGGGKSDTGQLSPLAQATSTLEQLQQNDPVRYRQATQQIAQNLNNASQTAQAQGNSQAAGQLIQLGSTFSKASTSGQPPDTQELAQAFGANATGGESLNPGTIVLSTLSNSGSGGVNG